MKCKNEDKNRQKQVKVIYSHLKSRDQSLDKISFDFSNISRSMQSCAMRPKSSMILKLSKSIVVKLEMGKIYLSRLRSSPW